MNIYPLVSIIIPNLNSPIIDQVVFSLWNQKSNVENIEIIVVGQDNFNLIPEIPGLINIHTTKVTPPALARNIGVKSSNGDLLIFIDADCIAFPDLICQHINAHKLHANCIVGGSVTFSNDNFWTFCDNISTFHEYALWMPQIMKETLPSLNLSMMKETWKELGGFNVKYPYAAGEDADLCFRAMKLGKNLLFFPDAKVSHKPERSTFKSICIHAYNFGKYSIKIDPIFDKNKHSIIFKYSVFLRMFSPLLSFLILFKMIFFEKIPIKFWFTLPIVFLTKIIWCFGAADGKKRFIRTRITI